MQIKQDTKDRPTTNTNPLDSTSKTDGFVYQTKSSNKLGDTIDIDITNDNLTLKSRDCKKTANKRPDIMYLLSRVGIKVGNAIAKKSYSDVYQITLVSSNKKVATHLLIKEPNIHDLDKYTVHNILLILKLGVLSSLIDMHSNADLGKYMIVSVDASKENPQWFIKLFINEKIISFDIDDLIKHDCFINQIKSNDSENTSYFAEHKKYFDLAINRFF